LTGLPAAQREVFLLRTEGELPFREIARLQGVSINTALARMQYAVEKLRVGLRTETSMRSFHHEL
jgi:RNA polymerase sigma-70 factor (ECF subfamily)